MTQDEIIEMAKEVGMDYLQYISPEAFEKVVAFVELVAQHERDSRRRIMDDDDIQEYESSGWRKRQISNRDTTNIRNATLEEVAQAFDKMKNGGDTSASFAIFVRGMKHDYFC